MQRKFWGAQICLKVRKCFYQIAAPPRGTIKNMPGVQNHWRQGSDENSSSKRQRNAGCSVPITNQASASSGASTSSVAGKPTTPRKTKLVYLVSRGTLLPSTQLSCSGTLSGGVACSSAGDWPATGAGLPVGGVSCRVELNDWPAWWAELSEWLSAVMEGCWRWGGGTGGRAAPW